MLSTDVSSKTNYLLSDLRASTITTFVLGANYSGRSGRVRCLSNDSLRVYSVDLAAVAPLQIDTGSSVYMSTLQARRCGFC